MRSVPEGERRAVAATDSVHERSLAQEFAHVPSAIVSARSPGGVSGHQVLPTALLDARRSARRRRTSGDPTGPAAHAEDPDSSNASTARNSIECFRATDLLHGVATARSIGLCRSRTRIGNRESGLRQKSDLSELPGIDDRPSGNGRMAQKVPAKIWPASPSTDSAEVRPSTIGLRSVNVQPVAVDTKFARGQSLVRSERNAFSTTCRGRLSTQATCPAEPGLPATFDHRLRRRRAVGR